MSSTYERLRRLQALRSRRASSGPTETSVAEPPATDRTAARAPIEVLEMGETVENSAGSCYLVTRRFTAFEQRKTSKQPERGQAAPGDLLQRDPSILAPLYPGYGLDRCPDFRTSAFLDIESTGLGGGAGIYAFMVGIGTFEQEEGAADGLAERPAFVVRQFFMRHPGEEPALLTALTRQLCNCSSLVTFNGRSFDAPLLRGRYRYTGRFLPAGVHMPSVLDSGAPPSGPPAPGPQAVAQTAGQLLAQQSGAGGSRPNAHGGRRARQSHPPAVCRLSARRGRKPDAARLLPQPAKTSSRWRCWRR